MRTKGRRIERGMIVLGVAIVGAAWMAVILAAAPPDRVNYQGVLRDATDHPRTGVFDMVFRLWTAPTSGDEVVVDSHLASGSGAVVVSGGLFNAVLGGGTVTDGSGPGVYASLGQAFQNYSPLYLEVVVSGETLSPRTPVNSTPYAVHAHVLDGKTSTDFVDVSSNPQTKAGALTVGGRLTVDAVSATAMVVSSGNVGIGTITPVERLDVAGSIGSNGPVVIRVGAGIAPLSVSSTALVPNFNADMVGGFHATDFARTSHEHDASYVRKSGDTMLGALTVAPSSATVTAFAALMVVPTAATGTAFVAMGRAGFGNATPTAQMDISALAVSGASEPVLRVSVADDPSSSLTIDNGSTLNGVFAPRLVGSLGVGSAVTRSALSIEGRIDADTGSQPAVTLNAATALGQSLTTRPLFRIDNNAEPMVTVTAPGRVGIGTITPAEKLDVAGGGIGSDGPIAIRVGAGTAPISVTSTVMVANFNADMVGGLHASDLATASHSHDASYVRKSGDTMVGALTVAPVSATFTAISAMGRVGVGVTTVTAQMDISALSVSGASEPVVRVSVSDDPSSSLTIDNGSTLNGVFAPRLRGDAGGDAVTFTAMSFLGRVGSDTGSQPAVSIDASTLLGQSLTTRPLFQVRNNAAPVATFDATGRLGLGTITPVERLDVAGSIGSNGPVVIRVGAGAPPLVVSSTAVVANLNADMVGGLHATDLATASHTHDASYVRKSGDTMLGALTVAPVTTTVTAFVAMGRVGLGTPTGTAHVDILAADLSGVAEPIVRVSVADDPLSSLAIDNGSSLNGVFAPRLSGVLGPGASITVTALTMEGRVTGDTGDQPAVRLSASTAQGQSLTTRPVFRIDNNEAPLVTVTPPGRVGIGTTTPAMKLDVAGGGIGSDGPIAIRVGAGTSPLAVTSTALVANFNADMLGGFHATDFARTSHGHDATYVRKSGDTMFGALVVNPDVATATAFVVASGNVGFGTTSPSARLDVRTDGDLTGEGGPVLRVSAVDDPTASLVLDDGNPLPGVFLPRLIGTASASPIAVSHTAMAIEGRVPFDNSTQPAVSFSASTVLGDALTVQPLFQFRNHETPVMTVDAQGHVGIGTTTPEVSLAVEGPIRASGPMIISVGAGDMPIVTTTTAMVQNLNVEMLGGFHAQDFAPALHLHDAEYVNTFGDTVFLGEDGLTVGTNPVQPQLAVRGGNTGIGTANPIFSLQSESFTGGFFKNLGTTNARVYLAGGSGLYRGWGVEAYGVYNGAAGAGGGGYFKDAVTGTFAAVAQNLSKIIGTGSVSFVQNHPYERDKAIVYVAPEGDETAVYTRGKARLVGGEARIALGDTFKWVANPDVGLTAYVTPRGEAVPLAVVSLTSSEMVVRAPASGPQDVPFDYIVYGLRIGFEEAGVVVEKHEEAKIPSMVNERARYEARPELRAYNALERFKAAEGSVQGIDASAIDLSRAAALKEAIGEFDPSVEPPAGAPAVEADLQAAGGARGGVAPGAQPATAAAVQGPRGAEPGVASPQAGEQDTYARSFRPSSPELAEFVPVGEPVSAGDVVVADAEHPGLMKLASSAADPAVVGIVSREPGVALGAGKAKIGESDSVLARQLEAAKARGDEAEATRLWSALEARFHSTRAPVAFTGIVVCKADAAYGAIRVGDLLTTSPTRGHAMRADHPEPGTVLGKALEPLASGSGLIKVLVMLR